MSDGHELILVADDDEDILRFVEVNLRLEGFEVHKVSDGEQALHAVYDQEPDLVLLDVMMPKLDGFAVCQRLRSDPRTKHVSIIMLTAKSLSADKVVGLTVGADDYMIKPFDPVELVARVKSALRRSREMRGLNPLTRLPGNVEVQEQVSARVAEGSPFALLYVDIDNFKAFNDHYGFLRGDEAIKLLASCVIESIQTVAGGEAFLGHIGGDDFVVVGKPDIAEALAKDVIARWGRSARSCYDPPDVERGYIEVVSREGKQQRFPVAGVSIGIATNLQRPIASQWEASEIATEMKRFAKNEPGSSYAMDRRRSLLVVEGEQRSASGAKT